SAATAAQNVLITLANYLNITNSGFANLNATSQELLSYFSDRAEAIVPYFLNFTTWNATMYDQIALLSGLVPTLEGMNLALGQQQFQDWNATLRTWNLAFGSHGNYSSTAATFVLNYTYGNHSVNEP